MVIIMTAEFDKWLDTLIEEKELDKEHLFEWDTDDGTFHIMGLDFVLNHLKGLKPEFQMNVKNKIVQIDFYNGDLLHFFKYIARGIAE